MGCFFFLSLFKRINCIQKVVIRCRKPPTVIMWEEIQRLKSECGIKMNPFVIEVMFKYAPH